MLPEFEVSTRKMARFDLLHLGSNQRPPDLTSGCSNQLSYSKVLRIKKASHFCEAALTLLCASRTILQKI